MSNQSKKKVQENFLNFNFDISAYRLLGRELITDRITALFEIVKNSYDANANLVEIEFVSLNPLNKTSKIIIKDDGIGMYFEDLRDRWMVIGTSSKRRNRTSPEPYFRKVTGKKGIGRFAVDLLGSKLTLNTKRKDENRWIYLETDWTKYNELEEQQLSLPLGIEDGANKKKDFFTDIKNRYWFGKSDDKAGHGTILEIEDINDPWTEDDIKRACKELARLVSPNKGIQKYPFNIRIKSEYEGMKDLEIKPLSYIEFATISIELKSNKEKETQEIAVFENGKLLKKDTVKQSFGLIDFYLYYFDQPAKRKFKEKFNIDIDGIKIYRDGIITTPFAETEADQNKQKDILGIDKRRYSGFFDKINSRDLLGFVELTDEKNSGLIEATNRQDFLDNKEWRSLKDFIIDQIHQIEKCLKNNKEQSRKNTKSSLNRATADLSGIKTLVKDVKGTAPRELHEKLQLIDSSLSKLQGTVNKSIVDYTKLEEESKQKESLYFSLVSLQTYAAMFSHMTKHTIGHVLRDAEYFSSRFPDEKLESRFKVISSRIYDEFLTLRKGVDFMLKYAQTDNEFEDINIHDLINNLFNSIYKPTFDLNHIQSELILDDKLILHYNKKALEDIFDNLISNSIKALKNVKEGIIKCSGVIENKQLILKFSDNGLGIPNDDRFRIFEIFYTKTAEDGGAGIGLYMVKNRIEAMQGTIEVTDSEFKPNGATFKIVLPFKK